MTNRTINRTIKQDADKALDRAADHARAWLHSLDDRRVAPRATADEIRAAFGGPMPQGGLDPAEVVDLLAAGAEPGLMAIPSGRFFGWVMGGTLPAGLAADWLVSAWDQNTGLRFATPAAAALEEVAAQLAARTARAARDRRRRLRDRRDDGELLRARRRPHPGARASGLGRPPRGADRGAPDPRAGRASSGTRRWTSPCATSAWVCPPSCRRTRRAASGSTP